MATSGNDPSTMNTWASYITEDLRARIRGGAELPAKLTLESLSQLYRVSLTPVRVAVHELTEQGFLRKQQNGRLTVNRARRAGHRRAIAPPAPPVDPYETIAKDLGVLSLKGRAVFVREEDTAQRYGIGRSAVRQVFNRLAGTGLLEHVPRCGWRLRPFRQQELDAFLEIRETLELKALDLAWPHLEEDVLRRIHRGNALPADRAEWPHVDDSLHRYIVQKAGNPYLSDFFERHGEYFRIFFVWEGKTDRESAIETVHQHRAVLEAILARDRRAARKALVAHIRFSHPLIQRMLAQAVEDGDPENKEMHDAP